MRRERKVILSFFVLVGRFLLPLSSALAGAPGKLEVYGNRIYDTETIASEAGLTYPSLQAVAPEQIRDRLLATGHFSRVAVTRIPDRIRIVVREKQPGFVLPYFASSSERKVFGLAEGLQGIGERARELLARYQIGNGDHEGSVFFQEDYAFDGFGRIGGTFQYQSAQRDLYVQRNASASFGNREYDLTLAAGYHFLPSILGGFDSHFEVHRFEGADGREVRGNQVSHRLFAELGAYYDDEGLARGFAFKPYVELTSPLSAFSFVQWGVFGRWSILRHGDLNWVAAPRYEAGQSLPRYQLFELGGPKLRGFPSEIFRSDHYSALQNDLVLASFEIANKLRVRPLAFFDWAYVENGGRSGAGIGVNVYFRHVSVPAVQIAAGYGFHPEGFSLAAAIGPQL